MSIAHVGNRGTANSKAAASGFEAALSMSPTQEIPAGAFVVVWYAGDSCHDPGGGDGDPLGFTSMCQDSAGNVYTTIAAATDGQSNVYSQCAIYVSRITAAITTSHSITVTQLVATSGQTTARAMSVHEFSMNPGKQWGVTDRTPQKVTNRASDPASITVANDGKPGLEYLYLHALSAEGPNTDAYTWDSDYTQISGDGTTGGADDTNIHLRGGFRIAAVQGDTVDVTSTTADRDYTQVLQSVTEVAPGITTGAFPRNRTILDDFNRADEDPVGNGLWDTGSSSPRSDGATTRHCRIVSNQLRYASTSSIGGSWYTAGTWSDVFACDGFDVFATVAAVGGVELSMRGKGASEAANADGIAVMYFVPPVGDRSIRAHLMFGSLGNSGRIDDLRGRAWMILSAGWKLGISMVRIAEDPPGATPGENLVYWWLDRGSGFESIFAVHAYGGIFAGYYTSTDVKIGIGIDDTSARIDDVGGGPTFGWCSKPGFIRRPWRYQGKSLTPQI